MHCIFAWTISSQSVHAQSGKKRDFSESRFPIATANMSIVDVHTGPGRGYPIFHTIEKGERVEILDKRTSWAQIRTEHNVKGWVRAEAFLYENASPSMRELFANRRWEVGFSAGAFDGAKLTSVYGAYHWTPNLSTELQYTKGFDDFFSTDVYGANMVQQPFPNWLVSPFFLLGAGRFETTADSGVLEVSDTDNNYVVVGGGVRMPIRKHFMLRLEYGHITQLTSDNDNREVYQWKAGFSVFY